MNALSEWPSGADRSAVDAADIPKGQQASGARAGGSSFAGGKSRASARSRKDDVDLTNPYTR